MDTRSWVRNQLGVQRGEDTSKAGKLDEKALIYLAMACISQDQKIIVSSDIVSQKVAKDEERVKTMQESSLEASGKSPQSLRADPVEEFRHYQEDELWQELANRTNDENIQGAGNWLAFIWPIIQALLARLMGIDEEPETSFKERQELQATESKERLNRNKETEPKVSRRKKPQTQE